MVHTAELTYRPTSILYRRFIQLDTTVYWQQEHRYVNESLSAYGITHIKARIASTVGYTRYEFVMRINFKRLIEQDDRMDIMHEEDLAAVYDAFNAYMQQLMPAAEDQPTMPRLNEWYVNRIDYCMNVRTQYASEYIRLLQKSVIPYCYRIRHDANRNYTHKQGSLYLVSSARKRYRSTTINFYDKYDEVKKAQNNGDIHITDEVLQQAKNILRLEVQCFKPKTDRIAVKYGFADGKRVIDYLNMQICYDVIEEAINRITKDATFQRRSVALNMIDQLGCKPSKKKRLKKMVIDIGHQHQSITKIKNKYIAENVMKGSTFDEYLRYLELQDINAVTISDNVKLQDKSLSEGLPSIYSIFNDAVYGLYH